MKKVKFALLGCGRIAQRHAEHINNFGELVAVCDVNIESANKIGQLYNTNVYNNIDDLLDAKIDIDVISICTPNGLHAEHSIKCLKKGYHVLCEKPLAINSIDAGEMIKAAESSNKRLFAIKQNRFNPPVVAIKKAIENGKFGKIFNVHLNCYWNRGSDYYLNSWKGTKLLDGGTLFTQFSHFIDLLYWLIGDIKNVESYISNYLHKDIIEFEDTGVVIIQFHNGAIGSINYTVNAYRKNMEGSLTIFGEKGTAKIGGQYLNELEYQEFENYKINDLPIGNNANNYGNYVGSMSNHDKIYENLIDVLRNGASITTNVYEALKTVEIIEKIYTKAKKIKDE
jgi:UDP-N-acetyl-2-amino-2-deoxyglucuronate dehydrogenase